MEPRASRRPSSRALLRIAAVAAIGLGPKAAWAANPSLSDDFGNMMGWLSQEFAQGLAFNAGSTFDPPEEVKGARLQPDISLGVGSMPFDKGKFPALNSQALRDAKPQERYPDRSLFPNLTMHLRAGTPRRTDFSIRFTNMTIPKNQKLSPGTTGEGQSNSIGFGIRKHLMGGEDVPMITLGANYNHVFGIIKTRSKFNIDSVPGFNAESDLNGEVAWNLNSIGLNVVVSQAFGNFIPFAGMGYNYASGSVRTNLRLLSNTPLIAPVFGEAMRRPETSSGRLILGSQWNSPWINFFANSEIKTLGDHSGKSWIIHGGVTLPFRIGPKRLASTDPKKTRQVAMDSDSEPVKQYRKAAKSSADRIIAVDPADTMSDLIFIQ